MRMYYQYGETGKPKTILVDMDGTLVDTSSLQDFLTEIRLPDGTWDAEGLVEFNRLVRDCPAIWDVVDVCAGYWMQGIDVVVVTAREEQHRAYTRQWLHKYGIAYADLFMRPTGDKRPDPEVKRDLLKEIRMKWDVVYAIDDNLEVLAMWDEEGIPTRRVPGWYKA